MRPKLLAGGAVIAAGILAGCSESRINASSDSAPAPANIESRLADQPAKTAVGQRFASAALDDRQLGGVRGGMSTGSGVCSLAGGGVTNHISNAANDQLVQQVITANIGITGLGQAIQQGVASTVMSRVQAATAQFR